MKTLGKKQPDSKPEKNGSLKNTFAACFPKPQQETGSFLKLQIRQEERKTHDFFQNPFVPSKNKMLDLFQK